MRIILCENYEEMSAKAANIVASQVMLKPDCTLGLATGSTPIGMYNKLAKMYENGEIDFSQVNTFNLDEYYPIKKDNDQSYDYFMRKNLFSKINIDMSKTHIPNGETDDPHAECENYEKLIKQNGGIDLQILGIGQNGHIGFNEPDACLNSYTHLTKLTENTIKANSRFFDSFDEVPKQALTMGISTILTAKKIILLASGASKSRVVAELLNDEINTSIPATMLKTHPDVILICDKDAYTGAKLGVDIGGTNIKFAVVEGSSVKHTDSIETPEGCEELVDAIAKKVNEIKLKYDIKHLGVGTPGIIKNSLVTASNLPFKETPLEQMLADKVGIPVAVDNDANCAALGEIEFGSTTDCDNIVLVTLGTGIGGGIIMNRQIGHGSSGMGEIGHIIVQVHDGLPCPCGLKGCWEQYASAKALIREATKAAKENTGSILYKLMIENNNRLNGKLIFEAMDKGCEVAKAVFDVYLDYLAAGIQSLKNVFGPDAIVLAGGVTKQGDKLLLPLREKLKTKVRIEISTLQSDAGALGAALL